MKRISLILTAVLLLTAFFTGCTKNEPVAVGYQGIDVVSPEWVGKLDAAKDAKQIFAVAALSCGCA